MRVEQEREILATRREVREPRRVVRDAPEGHARDLARVLAEQLEELAVALGLLGLEIGGEGGLRVELVRLVLDARRVQRHVELGDLHFESERHEEIDGLLLFGDGLVEAVIVR